ncbi:MAG TPA: hypothetical protein VJA94_13975 [Candidatus Angelobacter sp.]
MKDRNQKVTSFISIEQQHREAKQDETGKIRKYLELAEKLFERCDLPTTDAA